MPRFAHALAGCSVIAMIAVGPLEVRGFQGAAPSPSASPPADLDGIVTRFVNTAKEYQRVFLNLVAEETKVAELFEQSGRVKKQRTIVSDLLVYRPTRLPGRDKVSNPLRMTIFLSNSADTAEFRDVRAVDGKAVAKRSTRALELLTRASQSTSLQKELDIINRESFRYELGYGFTGLTINQPVWLESREKLRLEWIGRDLIGGHEVLVLDYQDHSPSTGHFNREFYTRDGFSSSIIRGRVWLDVASSRLRRDRWEIAGVHPALPDAVPIVRRETAFTDSRFGILVPERGVVEFFEPGKKIRNQPPTFYRAARTTFTYTAFRQFDVVTEETITVPAAPPK